MRMSFSEWKFDHVLSLLYCAKSLNLAIELRKCCFKIINGAIVVKNMRRLAEGQRLVVALKIKEVINVSES